MDRERKGGKSVPGIKMPRRLFIFHFGKVNVGCERKKRKKTATAAASSPPPLSYDGEEKGALMANYIRDDSLSLSHLILLRKLAQDFAEIK